MMVPDGNGGWINMTPTVGIKDVADVWVDEIKYDFDTIASAISACREADNEIHEAQNLLEQVKNHGDWKCKEREIIATEMDKLKKNFQTAVDAHDSLFKAVSKLKETLQGKEKNIKNAFDSVEDVIGSILRIPVKEAITVGTGILNIWSKNHGGSGMRIGSGSGVRDSKYETVTDAVYDAVDIVRQTSKPINIVNFSELVMGLQSAK